MNNCDQKTVSEKTLSKSRRNTLFNAVRKAIDTFRCGLEPSQFRDYILTLLFVKYLSDFYTSKVREYKKKYAGDTVRVNRAMNLERFVIPDIDIRDDQGLVRDHFKATFDSLYERRYRINLGEIINAVLGRLGDANTHKLHDVFCAIDFNNEEILGKIRQRNSRLKNLLEDLNPLDLTMEPMKGPDGIGAFFEDLIDYFASKAGKKIRGFYTPATVSETLARIMAPRPGDRICDPTCGSGSLLIRTGLQVGSHDYSIFGQEKGRGTWALCKMNMCMHQMDLARIEWEDTLRLPLFVDNETLMIFDVVVANPPFNMDKWGQEMAEQDKHRRFKRGIPPKSKGDWAFVSHMIAIAEEGRGRVGVIVPHGTLFRGGQEGKIREALINENMLDAVIGLPANLLYDTLIPSVVLIFDKARSFQGKDPVLFMDASMDYEKNLNRNRLRQQDIEKIVTTFHGKRTIDRFSRQVPYAEIANNDFNLNIPLYVDRIDDDHVYDMGAVQYDIEGIKATLVRTQKKIDNYLKELGV
ncbi:MAG: type I restriction-modification system subunit M [Proteobacteria bacterium]|nr:type I restriction-modification system subunit M [Pseudomonadota bacterium]